MTPEQRQMVIDTLAKFRHRLSDDDRICFTDPSTSKVVVVGNQLQIISDMSGEVFYSGDICPETIDEYLLADYWHVWTAKNGRAVIPDLQQHKERVRLWNIRRLEKQHGCKGK